MLPTTVSPCPHPWPHIAGYAIVEPIYVGARTVVYRAVENSGRPVIIKLLLPDYPSRHDLLQFRSQSAIAKSLTIPGIVQPYSLEVYGNTYALVMEDFGGISLREYAQAQPLSLPKTLTIVLKLTEILQPLYPVRIIHKNIKPANILIQAESKQIRLIDFSIASQRPKETPEIKHPHSLAGTLADLVPEQTGRDSIESPIQRHELVQLNQEAGQQAKNSMDISLENARLYEKFQQYAQDLERSEATNRALISAIPDLLIRVNREGIYLDIAGVDHLNVQNTDRFFTGANVNDSLPPDKAKERMHAIQQALETGKTQIYEQQFITADQVQYEEVRIAVCEQDEALIIVRDISDRKSAEATILKKSQELEQALVDLQNTQLQMVQNEKMASLGNLVAGVAHEINNPIGFLNGSIHHAQGYVQDLLAHLALYRQHHPHAAAPVQDHAAAIDLEFLCEDFPKLLDSMKDATDRITGISTSLRTFSRADTEYKVSANLHAGIESTLLILKYRLKANQHRPAIEVMQNYGQLPPIQCFPGQLNQVFMNILANAIDVFDEAAQQLSFAELSAKPQTITIQTALLPEHAAVEIRIRDNGKGMTEAVKIRIFDHLFTTKGVGKGTGLGLAIARQIVTQQHHGRLEVQSAIGQGTEFCIHLPTQLE